MIVSSLLRCAAIARTPPALIAGGVLTAVLFAFQTTRFRSRNLILTADASIVYEKSRAIWRTGSYPAQLALGNFNEVFPYPPSAVVLFALLSKTGPVVFHILWLTMMAIGLVATFRFVVTYADKEVRTAYVALMLPVIGLVSNPVVHDLSNLNNNFIVLGLAMTAYALMARHPRLAGALLSIPIALKLYVGAVLLWALIYRPVAAVACGIALMILAALPVVIFGVDVAANLYRGWLEQVAIVNGAWVYDLTSETGGPPLIALRGAAAYITGRAPFSDDAGVLLRALQAFWIAVLGGYFVYALRFGKVEIWTRAALADWAVLLLAPLPFSPWFEPHHGVPMLVPAALFVLVLFERNSSTRDRAIATSAMLAVAIIQIIPLPFAVRGLLYLLQFTVTVTALAALRSAFAIAPNRQGPLVQQLA